MVKFNKITTDFENLMNLFPFLWFSSFFIWSAFIVEFNNLTLDEFKVFVGYATCNLVLVSVTIDLTICMKRINDYIQP